VFVHRLSELLKSTRKPDGQLSKQDGIVTRDTDR